MTEEDGRDQYDQNKQYMELLPVGTVCQGEP
jgi:hypothetical protein